MQDIHGWDILIAVAAVLLVECAVLSADEEASNTPVGTAAGGSLGAEEVDGSGAL